MILQAEAILMGALARNESRGAHYKPAFDKRDDAGFLKATVATYDGEADSPRISYAAVDTSLVPPRARTYGKTDGAKTASAASASPTTSTAAAATTGV
jgi:succinate dehydrogenase / fumarate reductase flavoprotein subunit